MNTEINIRTNREIRDKAQKVFSALGISTSAGVNMFLRQVVVERGLPFAPQTDAKKIRARWDAQVKQALKGKKYKRVKIETVIDNPANRNFIRRNILTKGTIVKTELGKARITNRPGQEAHVNAVLIQ